MDRTINMIEYVPPILAETKEFQAICAAENAEIERLRTAYLNLFADQFIQTATENGIARLEKIMGIVPKGTDTLEIRRFRLLARKQEKLPYTKWTLPEQLAALCGGDGYSLNIDHSARKIIVRVALGVKGMYDAVELLLLKQRPANMVIDLSLLYNQWITLSAKRWSELSTKTWYQVRNEVV